MPIPNLRRLLESAAVVCTASGKFIFMDGLQWRFPFIMVTLAGWSFYIYSRWKKDPSVLHYWGFRKDNFKSVLYRLLPLGILASVGCVVLGYVNGTLNLTWHIIPILLLYPIWGTMQQFLCVGLVAGNIQDLDGFKIPTALIVLITALLFSLLHFPNVALMIGTFALAVIYSITYLRERNLFVLGLFHGWVGAIYYYTVVGKDPWVMVFH